MTFKHLVLLFLSFGLFISLLSACGRKSPLYIPTDTQSIQTQKDKAERDAVLKAREERQTKPNTKAATPQDSNEPPAQ